MSMRVSGAISIAPARNTLRRLTAQCIETFDLFNRLG
jgi:hypothetical protein